MKKKLALVFLIIVSFAALLVMVSTFIEAFSPDPDGPARMRAKYGCKPTNEFVGKNADRLWLCNDGLKHKESAFYSWSYQEKRANRGW